MFRGLTTETLGYTVGSGEEGDETAPEAGYALEGREAINPRLGVLFAFEREDPEAEVKETSHTPAETEFGEVYVHLQLK